MRKVVVVGTISNAERQLEKNLLRLIRSLEDFCIVEVYLVESDSSDKTPEVLAKLSSQLKNFSYTQLGKLKVSIPERIERIRYCRNIYVQHVRNLSQLQHIDFVIVADLDGMNSRISKNGINSSFKFDNWDVVLANQSGGYYDLLALRHDTWCHQDVMLSLRERQESIDKTNYKSQLSIKRFKQRKEFDLARKETIYDKMLVIPKRSNWIRVNSGFGGLGIYKCWVFKEFDYQLLEGDEPFESEHVALSKRITNAGGNIFINPMMINNWFNSYNINRFFIVRQFRLFVWDIKNRLNSRE